VRVPGGQYCLPHGGIRQIEKQKRQEMRNYRLSKYKARAEELGNSTHISSLKDEVAILRILIEEKINFCQDTQQLLLMSGPLSDLIMKCTVIVEKCHKLDAKLGNLLDRERVVIFAQTLIEIIGDYVEEEQLDEISTKITKSLAAL